MSALYTITEIILEPTLLKDPFFQFYTAPSFWYLFENKLELSYL